MTRMETTPGLERFSLSGRIALVTGATRGLGLEIARGMAAAGAVVGINGRSAERAREIAKSMPNAFPTPFDISDLTSAAAAIDDIVARHGHLDSSSTTRRSAIAGACKILPPRTFAA